jgi:hypothetical protein
VIELELKSAAEELRAAGVVGRRQLACVQTIDLARLTAHPVALVPGAFVAVGGRGPKGDSNESGKTSFLAAVSLLLGDPEWRLGGGGAASVSALLFEPETAGTSAQRFAPAQHGYVIGVFADEEDPQATALTVWCRLSAISPHVLVRWREGVHLAPGETDADRHLNADEEWRSLGTKAEAGAATYTSVLYGESPRVLAYVSKRGSQRSDPSLLQMNAGAFSPSQIGADLIRLTGRAGSFESEAEQRQRLDVAERRLAEVEAHDRDARRQEDATLTKLRERQDARVALLEAERLWSLHFARGYLDVLKSRCRLEENEREAEGELADAANKLESALSELAEFDAPEELGRLLSEANTTLARLRVRERTARQAAADGRALAAQLQPQLSREQSAAAAWSGTPLEACRQRLEEAELLKETGERAVWAAGDRAKRAEAALGAAEAGGEGAGEVVAALRAASVDAAGLLDVVEVEERGRRLWEPRLRLYANAVLVPADDEERALDALRGVRSAVLILGNGSNERLPDGIAAAPAHAHAFLGLLAERYKARVNSPPIVADAALGVLVLDQHDEPQTGRANRLARGARTHEAAVAALDVATRARDAAVVDWQQADADLLAAEAAARAAELATRLTQTNDQVIDQDRLLDELDPKLEEAEKVTASARLRVEAYEIARAKAEAVVELRRSDREQAEKKLDALRRQKDALQVEYWERGWGDTREAAGVALADEARSENTLRRRAGDELLDALHALGTNSDGSGAPTDELAQVARRRGQLFEDPSGRQPPSFDAVVAPLREWLDSHAEMDAVIAERIERTQAQRAAEIKLARHECAELHEGLASLQDAVEQRVRQALDEIGAAFDKLTREAGGFGAELAITTYRPRTPQERWRWEVTPRWRRSEHGRLLPYDSQMNTAQEKLFTVHLVLAALLAAPNPQGRVLIIDELGDSLGINHRREVLRAIAATAEEKGVLVLGTCQDSVLADAATFCDEILYFECPSKTDALNRPTRMLGFDTNGERVELAADEILAGRELL